MNLMQLENLDIVYSSSTKPHREDMRKIPIVDGVAKIVTKLPKLKNFYRSPSSKVIKLRGTNSRIVPFDANGC